MLMATMAVLGGRHATVQHRLGGHLHTGPAWTCPAVHAARAFERLPQQCGSLQVQEAQAQLPPSLPLELTELLEAEQLDH